MLVMLNYRTPESAGLSSSRPTLWAAISWRRLWWLPGLLVCAGLTGGCAALTNPVADGIPVRRVSPELLGKPRADQKTIPLSLLRQEPPEQYLLGPGDVLGVYIAGFLGDPKQPFPVRVSETGTTPPTVGYPIPVQQDGTIPLPGVKPVRVEGKTVADVEQLIRKAYTVPKELINPETAQIIVTLQRPRQYHVLVVREDAGGPIITQTSGLVGTSSTIIGNAKRGYGVALDLPAYENDVLNALTRTGGLPGLDALNEVTVQRGALRAKERPTVMPGERTDAFGCPTGACAAEQGTGDSEGLSIRLPLRLRPGEPIPFTAKDVVLNDGDVLFIRARDTELFYTGGLLSTGEYILPRDYDLDVVDAVAKVRAPLLNGGINQNNFTGAVTGFALGNPSPSQLSVVRRTACGGQIVIRVDLNRAMIDPRERILVQPGDVLILQETPAEAISRYFSQVFSLNFFGTTIRQRDLLGTSTLALPNGQ
jgi:protein involved in polysaccharide export with SLBB domain